MPYWNSKSKKILHFQILFTLKKLITKWLKRHTFLIDNIQMSGLFYNTAGYEKGWYGGLQWSWSVTFAFGLIAFSLSVFSVSSFFSIFFIHFFFLIQFLYSFYNFFLYFSFFTFFSFYLSSLNFLSISFFLICFQIFFWCAPFGYLYFLIFP